MKASPPIASAAQFDSSNAFGFSSRILDTALSGSAAVTSSSSLLSSYDSVMKDCTVPTPSIASPVATTSVLSNAAASTISSGTISTANTSFRFNSVSSTVLYFLFL